MIDLVIGYARGYNREEIRPFLASLRGTGYNGSVLLFADGSAAQEAKHYQVDVRKIPPVRMKVHSARFLCIQEAVRDLDCDGVLLADTRDIIFQKNIQEYLPDAGFHAYEEDQSQTLGSCPYNSLWIKLGYGQAMLNKMSHHPISCVGTSCGGIMSMRNYLAALRAEVERIQPKTNKPQDQAAHNYLIRNQFINKIKIWGNETGEIYTVGYIQRGTVGVVENNIVNQQGKIPAVIHQWDRHNNLKTLVEETWL